MILRIKKSPQHSQQRFIPQRFKVCGTLHTYGSKSISCMVNHIISKHFYKCYITATWLDFKNSCTFSSLKAHELGKKNPERVFISKQKYIFLENKALELLQRPAFYTSASAGCVTSGNTAGLRGVRARAPAVPCTQPGCSPPLSRGLPKHGPSPFLPTAARHQHF